mmetsp:Transcript_3444/g.7079  ORF Transcript_3444/g.7079 Transcript_3444/m.7079 type:complete len:322 (+) Transcript_3444:207-1172(+)
MGAGDVVHEAVVVAAHASLAAVVGLRWLPLAHRKSVRRPIVELEIVRWVSVGAVHSLHADPPVGVAHKEVLGHLPLVLCLVREHVAAPLLAGPRGVPVVAARERWRVAHPVHHLEAQDGNVLAPRALISDLAHRPLHSVGAVGPHWARRTAVAHGPTLAVVALRPLNADLATRALPPLEARPALRPNRTLRTLRTLRPLRPAWAPLSSVPLGSSVAFRSLVSRRSSRSTGPFSAYRTTLADVDNDGLGLRHRVVIDHLLEILDNNFLCVDALLDLEQLLRKLVDFIHVYRNCHPGGHILRKVCTSHLANVRMAGQRRWNHL